MAKKWPWYYRIDTWSFGFYTCPFCKLWLELYYIWGLKALFHILWLTGRPQDPKNGPSRAFWSQRALLADPALCSCTTDGGSGSGRGWLANATPPWPVSITPWFINMSERAGEKKHINYPIHSRIKMSGPRKLENFSPQTINPGRISPIWIPLSVNTINQDHSPIVGI